MPADNRGDWESLPDYLKKRITPHFVATFEDVIALCLR
jgi:ATP-dependent Lon protease